MTEMSSVRIQPTLKSFNSFATTERDMNVTGFLSGCRVVDKQFEYLPWDNPDNIITLVTQVNAYKAGGILIPWLGMLGVPLNILNCIVYKRLGLQERVNLLLFALSCADLVVTACVFALYVEYFYMLLVGRFTVSSTVVNVATNTGLTVIPFGSAFISGFISTLIACERCLCISHPFKAKRILRTKTTAVILIVSVVIILGIHYVIALKYRIGCEYIPSLKVSLTVFYPSEFYQENAKFVDILNVTTFGLVLPPLFVLTTVIATVITVVKLKGAAQWRQSTATVPVESKEIALTKMLIAVSILFIVCSIPNLVVKIVPLFVDGIRLGGRNQNILLFWLVFVNISNTVNSTLNFFFYLKMGSRFRKTLKETLRCSSEKEQS